MKNTLKLFLITIGTALALSFNTSCTPTEAAIVGGLAGAAIGVAAADGGNRGHGGHRGHGGYGGNRGHGGHGGHGGW